CVRGGNLYRFGDPDYW
nr:immunoglobulin heavy chain junction region [Macaca mulatta]MOX37856.1 immunoglobulin heavy chain junction region [Macaca mulatta]MOX37869.1 immunoglobulin heavy chain junction region [Macaca mulatta]MOX38061.1 immunoglobulin heavy chain junction region [Macaca mulatta]MOX38178.1 immunoglobulin heavy chain junction region [Macaca mulatta]